MLNETAAWFTSENNYPFEVNFHEKKFVFQRNWLKRTILEENFRFQNYTKFTGVL